jgi:putative ABC transport system permease protein
MSRASPNGYCGRPPACSTRSPAAESTAISLGFPLDVTRADDDFFVALNPIQAVGLAAYLSDFRIDTSVLLFSLAVTLLTGALIGLAPAFRMGHSLAPTTSLKSAPRGRTGGASGRPLAVLVIAEVALATTLLVGGGLLVQSFARLQRTDLGYDPDRLLTMELPLSRPVPLPQQVLLMDRFLERVRSLAGVAAAGMTLNLPLQRGVSLDSVFEVEGRPRENPSDVPITSHRPVSPGYLETLGVTLLEGRLLDERDDAAAPPVVVVSEELARQSWPGESAIGKRVRRLRSGEPGPWMTVVGVVSNVKEDRGSSPRYVRLRPRSSFAAILAERAGQALPPEAGSTVARTTVEILTLRPTMSYGLSPTRDGRAP